MPKRPLFILALRIPRQKRLAGKDLEEFSVSRDQRLALLRDHDTILASSTY